MPVEPSLSTSDAARSRTIGRFSAFTSREMDLSLDHVVDERKKEFFPPCKSQKKRNAYFIVVHPPHHVFIIVHIKIVRLSQAVATDKGSRRGSVGELRSAHPQQYNSLSPRTTTMSPTSKTRSSLQILHQCGSPTEAGEQGRIS